MDNNNEYTNEELLEMSKKHKKSRDIFLVEHYKEYLTSEKSEFEVKFNEHRKIKYFYYLLDEKYLILIKTVGDSIIFRLSAEGIELAEDLIFSKDTK